MQAESGLLFGCSKFTRNNVSLLTNGTVKLDLAPCLVAYSTMRQVLFADTVTDSDSVSSMSECRQLSVTFSAFSEQVTGRALPAQRPRANGKRSSHPDTRETM